MNYPKLNRQFTFACFLAPPIAGSAVSFLWHGGALWCLIAIVTGQRPFSRDRIMRVLGILLYFYVALALLSFFANGGDSSNASELLQLVTLLLFPFSYSVWSIARKTEIVQAAAFGSAIAGIGALVLALVQLYLDMRPEGGAGNPLVFATVASLAGIACLAGLLLLNSRWQLLFLAGFFSSLTAVILSGARSIWLSMAIATLLVLVALRANLRTTFRKHGRFALLAIVLVAILTSSMLASRVQRLVDDWDILVEQSSYDTSLGVRLALWDAAAQLIAERPLLGHGMQNTKPLVNTVIKGETNLDYVYTHFHNGFLTIAVESGMFAVTLLLAVFAVAFYTALKALRSSSVEARFGAALLLGLVVNYVVGGSFNLVLGHDVIDSVFMIFLIMGTWLACGSDLKGHITNRKNNNYKSKLQ